MSDVAPRAAGAGRPGARDAARGCPGRRPIPRPGPLRGGRLFGAAALAALVVGTAGCAQQRHQSPPQPLVATQPGSLRLDTARAVTIGRVNGPAEYTFGRIGGVAVGPDHRIYVAAAQALEVRVYSPTGRFLRRIGRKGDGPGEFRDIGGIGFAPAGTLAVYDGAAGKLSFFTPDGRFVRATRLTLPHMTTGAPKPLYFDDAGGFYDVLDLSRAPGVDSLAVVAYSPRGTVHDTLRFGAWKPATVDVVDSAHRIRETFAIPFTPHPSLAVGADGRPLYAAGTAYEVLRLGRLGDTMQTIRGIARPVPVSRAQRDSAEAMLRRMFHSATGRTLGRTPAVPTERPMISAIYPDPARRIWVRSLTLGDDGAAVHRLDVFSPTGKLLDRLPIPPLGQILQITDSAMAGIWYDSLQVPYARVIPLENTIKR